MAGVTIIIMLLLVYCLIFALYLTSSIIKYDRMQQTELYTLETNNDILTERNKNLLKMKKEIQEVIDSNESATKRAIKIKTILNNDK